MKIGRYEVLETIGRGSTGTVLRARGPGGELVAIKLLRDAKEPAKRARFERERRLLASFGAEDGFVPLLETGEDAGGVPWFVMPLLKGGTLRDRLERGRLGVAETRDLGRALATALGRAHSKGIVHRDLKPENVLFAADGRPLVADLGLAKHFTSDAPGASESLSISQSGQVTGTVGYLAPEQAASAKEVTPPADVFSLGAILYECLAGRPAFDGASFVEVLRKVLGRGEPIAPLARLRPDAPDDLVAVIERALARDPAARFRDGSEMALALGARGAPARAGGRRRALAVVAALLFLGVGLGVLFLGRRVPPAAPVVPVVPGPSPSPEATVPVRAPALPAPRTWRGLSETARLRLAGVHGDQKLLHADVVLAVAFSRSANELVSGSLDGVVVTWDAASGKELRSIAAHTSQVNAVAVLPGGSVLSGGGEGLAKLWDREGRLLRTLAGHQGSVTSVAVSPDGTRALTGGADRTVRLWDLATGGKPLAVLSGHEGQILSVALGPSGRRAVSASTDGTIRVWNLATGHEQKVLAGHRGPVTSVALAPDERVALSGGWDGTGRLWDLEEGRTVRVLEGHAGGVLRVAFDDKGERALSGSMDRTCRLYDVARGELVRVLAGHGGPVYAAAFSPDGKTAATGGADHAVRKWDLATGHDAGPEGAPRGAATALAWTADGRGVLVGGGDGALTLLETERWSPVRTVLAHEGAVSALAACGRARALSAGGDGTVKLWDLGTGGLARTYSAGRGELRAVCLSPAEDLVFAASRSTFRAYNLATGELFRTQHRRGAGGRFLAFAPRGERAALTPDGRLVLSWELERGEPLAAFAPVAAPVAGAFLSDGRRLLVCGADGSARLVDATSGELLRVLASLDGPAELAAASPDDAWAVAVRGSALVLWDLATGGVVDRLDLAVAGDAPGPVAWSPLVAGVPAPHGGGSLAVGTRRGVVLRLVQR